MTYGSLFLICCKHCVHSMLTGTPISGVTWKNRSLSSSEQLLAGLINQLHYCPHDVYLIIDDFHVINDRGSVKPWGI